MTWTKLGEEFGDEARGLTDAEFRTHVEALGRSNRRLLDLYVPKRDLRRFAETADPEAAAASLATKGWWFDAGEAWLVGVRFPEWQLEGAVIEYRRNAAALRQRRHRMHEAGDHSICIRGNCTHVTRDGTRDPERNGSVRKSTKNQVQVLPEPVASLPPPKAADEAGTRRQPKAPPQSRKTRGTTTARKTDVHDAQQNPVNGSAGARVTTVTHASDDAETRRLARIAAWTKANPQRVGAQR